MLKRLLTGSCVFAVAASSGVFAGEFPSELLYMQPPQIESLDAEHLHPQIAEQAAPRVVAPVEAKRPAPPAVVFVMTPVDAHLISCSFVIAPETLDVTPLTITTLVLQPVEAPRPAL